MYFLQVDKEWPPCTKMTTPRLMQSVSSRRISFSVVPALRLAKLDVSSAVIRGEPAWLNCSYTLEGDELYSVKWYKNNVEFYRFLPTDRPPGQKYDLQGVYVDVSNLNLNITCKIS
ncbi:uncharacterized protein NPIL_266891 [Nephila pilipes]|uniref:Ig-like domain-containing protein n=1 Tax=Nephila pilipes TaxID=299642 RepID=A0A8X6Q4U7_NEPPI|nr:uncharacterized protein NPIL_266891 [Nephila pilipes]